MTYDDTKSPSKATFTSLKNHTNSDFVIVLEDVIYQNSGGFLTPHTFKQPKSNTSSSIHTSHQKQSSPVSTLNLETPKTHFLPIESRRSFFNFQLKSQKAKEENLIHSCYTYLKTLSDKLKHPKSSVKRKSIKLLSKISMKSDFFEDFIEPEEVKLYVPKRRTIKKITIIFPKTKTSSFLTKNATKNATKKDINQLDKSKNSTLCESLNEYAKRIGRRNKTANPEFESLIQLKECNKDFVNENDGKEEGVLQSSGIVNYDEKSCFEIKLRNCAKDV